MNEVTPLRHDRSRKPTRPFTQADTTVHTGRHDRSRFLNIHVRMHILSAHEIALTSELSYQLIFKIGERLDNVEYR